MQLNYIKKNYLNILLLLCNYYNFKPFFIYYKFNFIILHFLNKNIFLKVMQNFSLKLNLKSLFKFGILRDILKLNLFFYKFTFLWSNFTFTSVFCLNRLKLTLLRSVFVNKTSKVQYILQNYICDYNIILSTSWFLFYWLFLFKHIKIIKYSKLTLFYFFNINLKKNIC